MITKSHTHETVSDVRNTPEHLLEAAGTERTTVSRVLEYVRGERSASQLKMTDWFNALEHVARDTDGELVIYFENPEDTFANARILSINEDSGKVIRVGWCGFSGEITGPEYDCRRDVEDDFRYLQSGDKGPEILELEEAKARFKAFTEEGSR